MELKNNIKGLKLLQELDSEIIKVAKIGIDKPIDLTGINKKLDVLKKELTASKSLALKSLKTLEDKIGEYSKKSQIARAK